MAMAWLNARTSSSSGSRLRCGSTAAETVGTWQAISANPDDAQPGHHISTSTWISSSASTWRFL